MGEEEIEFRRTVFLQLHDLTLAVSKLYRAVGYMHIDKDDEVTRALRETNEVLEQAFERYDRLADLTK